MERNYLSPEYGRLISKNPKYVLAWAIHGHSYGYPVCCIDHFMGAPFSEDYHVFNGKHNHSGFIPCPECKQEILDGKKTLSDLINYKFRKKEFGEFNEVWR